MSFLKKTWKNKGETGFENSAINANNLNDLENRIEDSLNPVVLFSGSERDNIELSDSVTNYQFIQVFFERNSTYKQVEIYNASNKAINVIFDNNATDAVIQIASANVLIFQNQITKQSENYINFNINNNTFSGSTSNNQINIVKVVGYK